MLAILQLIAPFALQIIGGILKRNAEAVEAQKAFLDFTQKASAAGIISVSLHESFKSQAKDASQKAAEKYAANEAAKAIPTTPQAPK